MDKSSAGQVFSENFGFPCQFSFHQFLHNHLHYHPRLAQSARSGRSANRANSLTNQIKKSEAESENCLCVYVPLHEYCEVVPEEGSQISGMAILLIDSDVLTDSSLLSFTILFFGFVYSSALKIHAACSFETSAEFHWAKK
jgi:hypothetical protein